MNTSLTHTPTKGSVALASGRVERFIAEVLESNILAQYPQVWITLRQAEDLRAEARILDERAARGEHLPLLGLMCGVKDNIDVAGLPTTAAHPAFARVPNDDATVVARLRDAGAIVAGKTNMDQFATGLTGARSPHGAVPSAIFPDRVSGGSSSGSGAAVGLGLVDFALATDTAGSGRIPGAFNGVVGIKPTLGLVPKDGVVPASVSFDCVTVLAPTLAGATLALNTIMGVSATDPSTRTWPTATRLAAPASARVALPDDSALSVLSPEFRALFDKAVAALRESGCTVETIDFSEFLTTAKMLYESALVAERAAAFVEHTTSRVDGTIDVVADVADRGNTFSAVEYLHAQDTLSAHKVALQAVLSQFDALLIPTAPKHPTIAETLADMAGVNTQLGRFTNFMNLLDLAGTAVPYGSTTQGAFGVTVVTSAFGDQIGVDLAAALIGESTPMLDIPATAVVVFGAHRSGQPLNHQLTTKGARLVGNVATAPQYTMHALPATQHLPARPALAPAQPGQGGSITGEEWLLTPHALGELLCDLAAPLALGPILLSDGRTVLGFTVNGSRPEPDITAHGDWLTYQAATASSPAK